ncbi:MAG: DNA mismatch repair endonuclease MutL [Anaerolineae bacterium]|nr:DNA mismatch repair endonuclease MutL [Anaerolineae bacterium]
MPIRILSDDLASKIAAGEVIERPASVVKELAENALDAGARDIRLEVRGGGQRLIRVADDGAGIPHDDVPTAFARHGTSKLFAADDLFAIQTLGFRGEALPSIAAVARITMISRHADEMNGTLWKSENAQTLIYQPHGAPRGTVVTVEDLFRNVPARLKFLKSPGAESAHIAELVHAYALAYPRVRFSLVSDGKLVFQSPGSGKLMDVLVKVFGGETAREMLAVNSADDPAAMPASEDGLPDAPLAPPVVNGYITPPSIHRGNRRLQYLFVNGRWIQDRSIAHAVTEAYHTMLMVGRYPVFVLDLRLAPDAVDVNVHPTKMQVRFREPSLVYRAVQRAVRRVLHGKFPVPTVAPASPLTAPNNFLSASPTASLAALDLIPPTDGGASQTPLHLPAVAADGTPLPPRPVSAGTLPMLRVMGQIFSTYIICEGPDGLYLVDQHAAHERVLYEKWMNEREISPATQELLEPLSLELSAMHWAIYESERENLERAGFRLEPFGSQTILLRAIPSLLEHKEPRKTFLEILDMTDEGGNPIRATAEARLVMSICKGAAIKGGQVMSLQEMRALIRDLENTTAPRTCPHGRPTMILMNTAMLEREFGRRG